MSGFSRVLVALALTALLAALKALAPEQAAFLADDQPEAGSQTAATNIESGFQDRNVVEAPSATALAFALDGRLFITDRSGRVLVREPGGTDVAEALNIRAKVCFNSERGLLGIALDPDFATNSYLYLFYTFKKYGVCPEKEPRRNDNPVNRISRFKVTGDTIARGSEEVLVNNIPSPNGNHNAGDLHFGKDGKLYASTGDGSCNYASPTRCQTENSASRDRNVLLGKILRVDPDGTIPSDNPYASAPNGVRCGTLTNNEARGGSAAPAGTLCKETFAWGFRNPFRFAMDPDATGTRFRINDVGGAYIEEVSVGEKGADYGWNCFEGRRTNSDTGKCKPLPRSEKPIHQYRHDTGCSSITGGAFVPNDAAWPLSYRDAYLFGDYVCGGIFALRPRDGGGYDRTLLAGGLQGGPVSLAFGPDGALYYTTYDGGGQVRRIAFVNNKAPVAKAEATPSDADGKTYGPTPLTVGFDASSTTDPENDNLTHRWNFGDPSSPDNTAEGITASHTYGAAGAYTATLEVEDSRGNTDATKVTIYAGNDGPPQPVIESPVSGETFEVGQQIQLQGRAEPDAEGPVALRWDVIRHHTAPNAHTHPYQTSTGPDGSFTAPAPEDLRSTNPEGNYVEVRFTATDAQGLSKTASRNLRPETTGVRFSTVPTGFFVVVNGEKVRAPRTLLAWENTRLNVYAPPQKHEGRRYVFRSWSDGRANRHTIVTPQERVTYTARFKRK